MKRAVKMALVAAAMTFLAACATPEYIISTTSGTMITTKGQPKLDEKTGMYKYKDAEGRAATIKKEDVKQVMER